MTALVLTPTFSLELDLVDDGGNEVRVRTADDALVVDLAAVLRGERGPAGYGLLGYQLVTDEATVQVDLSKPVGVYVLNLADNRTLEFINGSVEWDRKRFILEVTQAGGGSKTLTPGATVSLGSDIPAISLSGGVGTTDALGFIYRHTSGKCHLLAINHGA